MNPFELSAKPLENLIMNWGQMTPVPYDKRTVDPYTRCRVILMNGTEFEQVWYGTSFRATPATTSFGGRSRCCAGWSSSSKS